MKNVENYQSAIVEQLKELGIKVAKMKKHVLKQVQDRGYVSIGDVVGGGVLFGHPIQSVSRIVVDADGLEVDVPRFLVDALNILRRNLDSEGLFRKTGSISRQKELKRNLDLGLSLDVGSDAQDIASLVKHFLRCLPEPLLVKRLHDTFIRLNETEDPVLRKEALQLVCLLLPNEHLAVLRYLMLFMAELAGHDRENKMTVYNLAVVLTPNIIVSDDEPNQNRKQGTRGGSGSGGGQLLRKQTDLVQLLIKNASYIGHVPDKLLSRIRCQESTLISEDDLVDGVIPHSSDFLSVPSRKKVEKKRHSINGVLHGLRRIVHPIRLSSECSGSTPDRSCQTPSTPLSATKRKHDEDQSQWSSSKKRAVMQATCVNVPHPVRQPHFDSPDPVANENAVSSMPTSELSNKASSKRKSGRMRFFGKTYLRRRTSSVRTPKTSGKPPSSRGIVSCGRPIVKPTATIDKLVSSPSVPVFSLESSPATYFTRSRREEQNMVSSVVATASLVTSVCMMPSVSPHSPPLSKSSDNFKKICDVDDDLADELDNNLKLKQTSRTEVRKVGSLRRTRSKKDDEVKNEIVTPPPLPLKSNFSRSLNRSALRRGRPNTVRSGLPAPSPFKSHSSDPDNCNTSDPGPVSSPSTPSVVNGLNMTRNLSCTPVQGWPNFETYSPCPMLIDLGVETKKKTSARKSLDMSLDSKGPDEENVDDEPKRGDAESSDGVFLTEDGDVDMSVVERLKTPLKSSLRMSERSKDGGSDGRSFPNDVESLTKPTNDHVEIPKSTDAFQECKRSDSNWMCAASALNDLLARESDLDSAAKGRPSLVRLKKEKAGMVMASIKKYNEIASNTSIPLEVSGTKDSFRVASPVHIPRIFSASKCLNRESELGKSPSAVRNTRAKRNGSIEEKQKGFKNGSSSSSRMGGRSSKGGGGGGRSRLSSSSHSQSPAGGYRSSPRSSAQRAMRRSPRFLPDRTRAKAASDAHRRRVRVSVQRRSTVL